MDDLNYFHERIEYLQSILIDEATGGNGSNNDYQTIRNEIITTVDESIVPRWLKTNRSLSQFWQFIKHKFPSYAERREFLWSELNPIIEHAEHNSNSPVNNGLFNAVSELDKAQINSIWHKALKRKATDPEGAITIARTMLETVCKQILDKREVPYQSKNIELSVLYKLTAKELNLSTEQHEELVFKQILGGCSGIVNGLGTLRNKLGDAHGKGKNPVKPKARHAELAVNLAGSMALFLIATYEEKYFF